MTSASELRSGKTHRDENFPVASWIIHPRHRALILAFYNFVRTADDIVAQSIGPRRFNMLLLGSFAAVALILASVGLFGVMSYVVSQRTHDIGVRLALGASKRDVFRLIVGRGMLLATIGAATGLSAAFWLSRSLEALLFQVRPTDALTFAIVIGVLLAVALFACALPARRATRCKKS